MLKKIFFSAFLLTVSAWIGGCSGGGAFSDDSSTSSGSSSSGQSTVVDSTIDLPVAQLAFVGQSIIAVGATTTITVKTLDSNDNPVGNAPLTFSSSAALGNLPTQTGLNGQATFQVTSNEAGPITVTVGSMDVTASHTLHFGAQVTTELLGNDIPANGIDVAILMVRVMDYQNLPLEGVSVKLAFSPGSFAVSTLAQDTVTDFNGVVMAGITDTIAETVTITPIVGGGAHGSVSVKFSATALADPHTLTLTPVKRTASADNVDQAELLVVARDVSGTPVSLVPVKISVSSGSAVATPVLASTSESGSLSVTITNPVVETVSVTATSGNVTSESATVAFVGEESTVSSVIINVSRASVIADGTSNATLTVYATDVDGKPAVGEQAYVRMSGGSAILSPEVGSTDQSGRFVATISNLFAENIQVTGVVGGVESAAKTIVFEPSPNNQENREVGSISLVVVNEDALVTNDSLLTVEELQRAIATITAIVKDKDGVAMNDQTVEFITDSPTAILGQGSVTTTGGGTAITTLQSTVPETVFVRARIGNTSSVQKSITFSDKIGVAVATVEAVVNPNNQPADGSAQATLTVVARDQDGQPVTNAEVKLSFSHGSAVPDQASGVTDGGGSFVANISDTVPETFLVTAKVDGVASKAQSITFIAVEGDANTRPAKITTTVNQSVGFVNGDEKIVVTVIPRDSRNVPIKNLQDIELSSTSDTLTYQLTGGADTGAYTFELSNSKVEANIVITPYVNQVKGQSVTVEFQQDPAKEPSDITVTLINNGAEANGAQPIAVTVVAHQNGVPVTDAKVKLQLSSFENLFFAQPLEGVTDAQGQYTVLFNATSPGDYVITPTVGTKTGDSVTINFVAEGSVAQLGTLAFIPLTVTEVSADGSDVARIKVFAKKASGEPLKDVKIKLTTTSNTAIIAQSEGVTGENGIYETTITNTVGEIIEVNAFASDFNLAAESLSVTFGTPGQGNLPPDDASMDLLLSSPVLASEGKTEGIIITARIKTKDNNPFANASVRFKADSGDIQVIPVEGSNTEAGVTSEAGIAQARLTTVGNPINRIITITAESGSLSVEKQVEVNGTNITITGPDSITVNSTQSYSVFLKDSAGNGLANQKLTIASQNGNTISTPEAITDGSGRVEFEANIISAANTDVITATLVPDPKYAAVAKTIMGNISLTVSQDSFVLVPDASCEAHRDTTVANGDLNVPLGQVCLFTLTWEQGNPPTPVGMQPINLSTTRGTLVDGTGNSIGGTLSTGRTDGRISFGVRADNAGPATITAKTQTVDGPSSTYSFFFVSVDSQVLDLQANPASVGVNQPGSEAEQSEIIAVVRDGKNNLVKGARIDFLLDDVTGGKISPSSAVTDQFGRASTVYIAGSSSSAASGVIITARTGNLTQVVNLTVAEKGVFVAVGTGNTVIENAEDPTTYSLPYSVLVTDINGAAVSGAEVVLSLHPMRYEKGYHEWSEVDAVWIKIATLKNNLTDPGYSACMNEDRMTGKPEYDFNGILDPEEKIYTRDGKINQDYNGNLRLDPGNIATIEPGTVITDSTGYAAFNIVYAQENAHWVDVRLTARTVVSGTEDADITEFLLPGVSADYTAKTIDPPGVVSPFGSGTDCQNTL